MGNLEIELLWDRIADALVDTGYIVLDDIVPDDLLKGLLVRLGQLESDGMRPAGVGRGQAFHQDQQVRGDHICWLSNDNFEEQAYLLWMDNLRQGLNQRLFIGLQDYESHFAVYPAGSFYQKHLDAFRDAVNSHLPRRKITTVFYLNADWSSELAGELIIYDEKGESILEKISPVVGRLVIFMSDKFPHEVKASTHNRRSIAGWFRGC